MKNRDILFPWFDTGTKRQTSQNIHDLGNIDIIRTPNTAGIARGADPDCL
jgi:hypothetical protein